MRGRMPRHDDLLERLMAKVRTKKQSSAKETGANLGFEGKLWQAADALRNNMDAAEYKHVVLGLIFLKYISDAFEGKHADLVSQKAQVSLSATTFLSKVSCRKTTPVPDSTTRDSAN